MYACCRPSPGSRHADDSSCSEIMAQHRTLITDHKLVYFCEDRTVRL